MAPKALLVALSMVAAASPAVANTQPVPANPAPPGTPATRYCMHVEITGNLIDPVECWTREEWAEQGVDVDREWAKEGVRTIG